MKLIVRRVEGLEKERAPRALRFAPRPAGQRRRRPGVEHDGKVTLVVSVTKDLTSRVQAGKLVKELAPIVGGGGGGRPDFAEAGARTPRASTRWSRGRRRGCSDLNFKTEIGACSFRTPAGFSP